MLYLRKKLKDKIRKYHRRKVRTNEKVKAQLPEVRVIVNKTNKYIKVQAIDATGKVVAQVVDKNMKGKTKVERATQAGEELAKLLAKAKVEKVTFDRNGHLYHGRVKGFIEGLRTGKIAV